MEQGIVNIDRSEHESFKGDEIIYGISFHSKGLIQQLFKGKFIKHDEVTKKKIKYFTIIVDVSQGMPEEIAIPKSVVFDKSTVVAYTSYEKWKTNINLVRSAELGDLNKFYDNLVNSIKE